MLREEWIQLFVEEFSKYVDWDARPKKDLNEWILTEAEYAAMQSEMLTDPVDEAADTAYAIQVSQ